MTTLEEAVIFLLGDHADLHVFESAVGKECLRLRALLMKPYESAEDRTREQVRSEILGAQEPDLTTALNAPREYKTQSLKARINGIDVTFTVEHHKPVADARDLPTLRLVADSDNTFIVDELSTSMLVRSGATPCAACGSTHGGECPACR